MSNWKRKLALLLTLAMLISALPLNASAAEEAAEEPTAEDAALEEIGFQMRYMGEMVDAIATVNLDKLDAGVEEDEEGSVTAYYVPFEDDGGYTFYPERTEMPYTVRFDVNGREFVYVFGTESDTTVIGGHEFRVECQDTPEPEVPEDEQLYVTVGGEEIPLIPQDGPATMSMLPLKEEYFYNVDLHGYFLSELKEFGIESLLEKIKESYPSQDITTTPNEVAVWAKWDYYDENGNRISKNDNYTIVGDKKVIDLSCSGQTYRIELELIVGKADQLNLANVRYIIYLYVDQLNYINPFTFTFNDVGTNNDPVFSSSYSSGKRYGYEEDEKARYYALVKEAATWNGRDPISLKMEKAVYKEDDVNSSDFWEIFNDEKLDYKVYEGYHETSDSLNNAVDIREDFEKTGILKDYTYHNNIAETPAVTVVFYRDGKEVHVMPFYIQVYKSVDEFNIGLFTSASSTSEWRCSERDTDESLGITVYKFTRRTYESDASGEYYARVRYYHDGKEFIFKEENDTDTWTGNIRDYVTKTVAGHYTSEHPIPSNLKDITDELFGSGYFADYNGGKVFTVLMKDNSIKNFEIKIVYEVVSKPTEKPLPSAPTPLSEDTYFRMEGALQAKTIVSAPEDTYDARLQAYVMPYNADGYYYNGFQTVFLLDGDEPVEQGSTIKPVFATGTNRANEKKIVMFAGAHDVDDTQKVEGDEGVESAVKQVSGESTQAFKNGESILYSAAAENGANLKNYWVTFVTRQENKAELFVNGINEKTHKNEDGTINREVILTDAYGNYHDIFFANIGEKQLEGLSVKLEDAQNVALDEYWTIGMTKTLAPFTTTSKTTSNGELANVGKIRLVPQKDEKGNIMAGDIKGTLTISSTNGGTVKLKLTGKSGAPKIITDKVRDGIKYVHYSSLIQTNYMYGSGDIVFTLTSGSLPNGMRLKPNGEVYGVPTEVGTFTFGVTATNQTTNLSDTRSYTFKIEENTNQNVENANYDAQGYPIKYRLPDSMTTAEDRVFGSEGEYADFMNVYLDGRRLTEGSDYTAESGSTKITVRAQTFRNSGNGNHTISTEFRTNRNENATMKRTAQNFTISGLSTPSGGGSSGGGSSSGGSSSGGSSSGRRPSSSTPKPATKPAETPAQTPTTPTAPATTAEKFKDISAQQWFYADVDWAFKNNLMVGVTDSSYHPYDKISFVTGVVVLSRLDKVDLDQQTPAEGIPAGQWYTAAASWAKANDLLPENGFQGSSAMSRGEMAVMLLKYLKYMKVDCSLLGSPVEFTDAALMTQEQNDAFQVLYQFGIFKGVGNQTMDVSGSTTRAQFAALLHRLSVFAEAQQKNA